MTMTKRMTTNTRHHAVLALVLAMASALPAGAAESGSLTLEQAISRALERGPQMLGAAADSVVADARLQGARAWPSPTLDIASENVLGSGPFSGFDSAETTIAIAQDLPLGGQRAAAVRSARAGQDAAAAQQQLARLALRRDVTIAFAEAIAADRIAEIARDRARIATETRAATQQRLEAGLESELQRARTEVATASAQAASRRAASQAMIARRHLAQFWRDDIVSEPLDSSWFDAVGPASETGVPLDSHPQRIKARHELTRAQSQLAAERARRIPVVTATFGVRRFPEAVDGEDQAYVLGLSVPLPFGDRNAEGIADARAQLLQAELADEAALRDLRATQASMSEELEAAMLEVRGLMEHGVPAAQSAAELAQRGHAAGRVPLEDRLSADSALADEREKLVHARLAAHRARAALGSLVSGTD